LALVARSEPLHAAVPHAPTATASVTAITERDANMRPKRAGRNRIAMKQ